MDVLIIEDRDDKFELYLVELKKLLYCEIDRNISVLEAKKSIKKKHYNLILINHNLLDKKDNLLDQTRIDQANSNYSIIIFTDNFEKEEIKSNCFFVPENNILSKEFSKILHKAIFNSLPMNQQQKKMLNIAIIEDSVDDYELYERKLSSIFENFNISHYISPCKALEEMKAKSYDLILLDYQLPEMSGIDFLNNLYQQHCTLPCPIIALTGQGNEGVAVEIMKLGVQDYITKDNISLESLSKSIYRAFHKFNLKRLESEKKSELLLFAHTVAHDIKAPLGRISSYANLLKININEKFIDNIIEDSAYIASFLDSLLCFAELGRSVVKKSEIDLALIVEQAIKNLEIDIKNRKAKITVSKLPIIYGDKVCLIQLFQNLISNSLKYCVRNPLIKISAETKNNFVIVNVTDNGIGILKKMAKKIFKPFVRVANGFDTSGIGLGLALCDLIAKQHQGKINAYPQKTGGTIFSVIFPAYNK